MSFDTTSRFAPAGFARTRFAQPDPDPPGAEVDWEGKFRLLEKLYETFPEEWESLGLPRPPSPLLIGKVPVPANDGGPVRHASWAVVESETRQVSEDQEVTELGTLVCLPEGPPLSRKQRRALSRAVAADIRARFRAS